MLTYFKFPAQFTGHATSASKGSGFGAGGEVGSQIEIELDPLNDHECMASLIALIHYMHDNKIITKPTQTEASEEENDKQVTHIFISWT